MPLGLWLGDLAERKMASTSCLIENDDCIWEIAKRLSNNGKFILLRGVVVLIMLSDRSTEEAD